MCRCRIGEIAWAYCADTVSSIFPTADHMLAVVLASAAAYVLQPPVAMPVAAVRPTICVVGRAHTPSMQFDMGKMGSDFMKKTMGMGGPESGLSEEDSKAMEDRLKNGEMTFDDFLKQVQVMQKTAGLQSMLAKGPFGGQSVSDEQVREGQKKLSRYSEFVESMDAEERGAPDLLIDEAKLIQAGNSLATAPRLQRIADASSGTIDDVGRFVMEFNTMRTAAVRFARGDNPEDIKAGMMAEQNAGKPPPNRKQRRMAAKKQKKKPVGGAGGFGGAR